MNVFDQVKQKLWVGRRLADAGIVRPMRPDKLVRLGREYVRWKPSVPLGYAASAIRNPEQTAVIDELGTLTFADVERRSNALARALSQAGVGEGDGVGILCRNHRGFIDATVACGKLGATRMFLNTQFAKPQVTDVMDREGAVALVYDEEFGDMVADVKDVKRFIAWFDGPEKPDCPVIEDLIRDGDPSPLDPPGSVGKFTILTSGTTGTPKGASRDTPTSPDPLAALLARVPMHAGEPLMIAVPLFHLWGFMHFGLSLTLGSTIVLRRKFDPEQTLSDMAQHEVTSLAVVPVMLQRLLELGDEVIGKYDLSKLRTINVSGSAFPGELAVRVMDAFGDKVYNLYGSTEVGWASIAVPEDLRDAPGTAGYPPRGVAVKILDEDGKELPTGETGRIFVGSELQFEGYTGGGGKEVIDGLMSSGDVGHFDEKGRLFIDGRDDEMIVSGGENVFPREVEDLLSDHEAIEEAAVIGVDDEEWGQRLAAFIVKKGDLDADEVKRHVKENLAKYKVPRDVEFVDELPRNAAGKVVKNELKEKLEEAKG